MSNLTRRSFVDGALKTSLTLTYCINETSVMLTPRQARAEQVPLHILNAQEAAVLELMGEAILPGAAEAGLVNFIDHQLAVDPNQCLLIAKYLQVTPPYLDFYRRGTQMLSSLVKRNIGGTIENASADQRHALVGELLEPGAVIDGFAPFLFYLCLRSDAVDVFYGTPAGFQKLDVPYMQHIAPPADWNG